MTKGFFIASTLFSFFLCMMVFGTESKPGIRYKKGKDHNFEGLLVQGQLKRPEMSVVTGDVRETTDGLLRLRENFLDRMAIDSGEEIP